jgi:plastocyanin
VSCARSLGAACLAVAMVAGGCGGSVSNGGTNRTDPGGSGPTTVAGRAVSTPLSSSPATVASSSAPVASSSATVTKPAAPVFVIHIRDFAYQPSAPVVLVGQRVEVINDDGAAHTWSAAPRSKWNYTSGNLEQGQRAIFGGFISPGRYPFLCYYHAEMPSMNGTITVKSG